jgi:hypothetical protein
MGQYSVASELAQLPLSESSRRLRAPFIRLLPSIREISRRDDAAWRQSFRNHMRLGNRSRLRWPDFTLFCWEISGQNVTVYRLYRIGVSPSC